MTRPLDDDTGESRGGAARASKAQLQEFAWTFEERPDGLIRVVFADGDDSLWERDGKTYRRIK